MKKKIVKCIDNLVKSVLKTNINSTTSFTAFQPAVPKELKTLSKVERE